MKSLRVLHLFILGGAALFATGCDNDRISKLEKENQELKAKVDKSNVAQVYDLQAKCSKDARAWFNENWSPDKDTILLDFHNHYNKASNSCFIIVEYHANSHIVATGSTSWTNDISLWNIYENSQYGTFTEDHTMDFKNPPRDEILTCTLGEAKCTSVGRR